MNDSLHELEASPMKVIKELVKYLITGQSMLSLPFQASTTLLASRLLDNDYAVSMDEMVYYACCVALTMLVQANQSTRKSRDTTSLP